MGSAYLTLAVDTESDAKRVYGVLTDGREIFMKMEKTPVDRYFAASHVIACPAMSGGTACPPSNSLNVTS